MTELEQLDAMIEAFVEAKDVLNTDWTARFKLDKITEIFDKLNRKLNEK